MVQSFLIVHVYFLGATLLARQIACLINPNDVDPSIHRSAKHVFRQFAIKLSSESSQIPERAPFNASHEVVFVVRQRNIETLTKFVDDVSNPKSKNYGKYKTRDEIGLMTENIEASRTIRTFLAAAGARVTEVSPYQEYITACAPVHKWEEMFNTNFRSYNVSAINGTGPSVTIYRADRYSVPVKLDAAVASVLNTVQMPEMQAFIRPPSHLGPHFSLKEENVIEPSTLIKAYEIDTTASNPRATQSIFEAGYVRIGTEDLAMFQDIYNLPKTLLNSSVGGHADSSSNYCAENIAHCLEGNLDSQYIMALSPKSPTISHYAVGFHSWTVWLIQLASSPNIPLVMSISYCSEERVIADDEQEAFNTMAIKLSAMGVTLVAASGDGGATTNWRFVCEYVPQFPATCPYVLTVGGTMVS